MRLYIPHLKDQLRLTKPWTFNVHCEWRNEKLMDAMKLKLSYDETIQIPDPSGAMETYQERDWTQPMTLNHSTRRGNYIDYPIVTKQRPVYITIPSPYPQQAPITLPKGTLLIVDRIYIRHGGPEYDSVTFRIPRDDAGLAKIRKDGKATSVRFWAKLPDVNTMNFELVPLE